MGMLHSPAVQVVLWLVAALATIWILVPGVMFAVGFRRHATAVSESPLDAEPRGDDPEYERKFRALEALGFRPAGRTVESIWFFTPLHWHWRSNGSRWMASADGKTFVSFHRVGGANPLRTSASTLFEGGGLLQTATPGVGLELDLGGNYRRTEIAAAEPAELLAKHQAEVDDFRSAQRLVVRPATLPEAAAEMDSLTRRVLPTLRLGGTYAIVGLFLLPLLAVVRMHGRTASMRPLFICAAAAMFALVRWAILPSRVPRALRMAIMLGAIALPSFGLPFLLVRKGAADVALVRAIADVDADLAAGRPPASVPRIVGYGPKACRLLLRRIDNPATRPETRRVLHDVLVELKGADLGPAPDAWRGWCAEALRPK